MRSRLSYICFVLALAALASCAERFRPEAEPGEDRAIEVGVDAVLMSVSSDIAPLGQAEVPVKAEETTSRPAEWVSWLIQPLKQGLDITYGLVGNKATEKVAILKLQGGTENDLNYDTNKNSGYAVYTFNYRDSDGTPTYEKAEWLGNGPHYFEGVHVPNRIRYSANASELDNDRTDFNGVANVKAVKLLTTDQSDDAEVGDDNSLGNYVLLSHYLGMPANTKISATVSRILLPFRHRLSHVLAYILIDPSLGTTIKGYTPMTKDESGTTITAKDDPSTSSIRFCNVDVLRGVHDVYNENTKLHTLTPDWAEKVRKVVPHFYGELESIAVYMHIEKEKFIYPSNKDYSGIDNWYTNTYNESISAGKTPEKAVVEAQMATGYSKKVYTKVPVYDLIVRPTYTSYETVMYDEKGYGNPTERQALANKKNKIDFELTLSNGLSYQKEFVFDLDANYETIVYLTINREGIDYNSSGADTWIENSKDDYYYGVDNKNGNTLSKAGSSWQRAFTRRKDSYVGDGGDKVTDGGFYDEGTDNGKPGSGANAGGNDDATGQYLSEATWIRYFSQAYEGGAHHGDYFILSLDMTIDARSLPDDFVFTGHLDAFGQDTRKYHTITLTNTDTPWKEYLETTDYELETLYRSIPSETYSDDLGEVYSLPELYTRTHYDDVYYTQEECDKINSEHYIPYEEVPAVYYQNVDEYNEDKGTNLTEDEFNKLTEEQTIKTAAVIKNPGDEGYVPHYEDRYTPITVSDIKTPAHDVYTPATPTIAEVMNGPEEYYVRVNDSEPYSYELYDESRGKPSKLYKMIQHRSGTALFSGLDGKYVTNQEEGRTPWEANVHKETVTVGGKTNTFWIPYKDETSGWRAEVMNLTLKGAKLFREGAVESGMVTGNVENCKDGADGTERVEDHTPAMPKYY